MKTVVPCLSCHRTAMLHPMESSLKNLPVRWARFAFDESDAVESNRDWPPVAETGALRRN